MAAPAGLQACRSAQPSRAGLQGGADGLPLASMLTIRLWATRSPGDRGLESPIFSRASPCMAAGLLPGASGLQHDLLEMLQLFH